jgi:hypothetical protein
LKEIFGTFIPQLFSQVSVSFIEAGILQLALQKMYCLLYWQECLLCIFSKEMPRSIHWTGFYM